MQNRDEYKHTASFYDLLFSKRLASIRGNIRTFLKHCKATNVLDLCCGTGEQLRLLSCDDMVLTGVDMSPAMLTRARATSPAAIRYLESDASKSSLPESTYDAIIISFALHEKSVSQHTAIFHEACRLIKHTGHIIIADYCTPASGYSSYILGKLLIPAIERAAGSNHHSNYKTWMGLGAIDGFLQENSPGKRTLIAPHFKDCVKLYAVSRVKDDPLSASLRQERKT